MESLGCPLENLSQETFAQTYAKTFSPTKSAIAAGGNRDDPKALTRLIRRLMSKYVVRRRIDELVELGAEQYKDVKRRLINELSTCAFQDFQDTFDLKKMSLKSLKEVDGRLIKKVSKNKDGTFHVELVDKMRAMELLGKHLGVFQEQLNINHKVKGVQISVIDPATEEALREATDN